MRATGTRKKDEDDVRAGKPTQTESKQSNPGLSRIFPSTSKVRSLVRRQLRKVWEKAKVKDREKVAWPRPANPRQPYIACVQAGTAPMHISGVSYPISPLMPTLIGYSARHLARQQEM